MSHIPDIFLRNSLFEFEDYAAWFASQKILEDPSLANIPTATLHLLFEPSEMIEYAQKLVSLDLLTPDQWCDFSYLMDFPTIHTPSFYTYYNGQPQPKNIQRGMVSTDSVPQLKDHYIPKIVEFLGFKEPNEVVYPVVKITHELQLSIAAFFEPSQKGLPNRYWAASYYMVMLDAYLRTGSIPVTLVHQQDFSKLSEEVENGEWEQDGWNAHKVNVIRSDLKEALRALRD